MHQIAHEDLHNVLAHHHHFAVLAEGADEEARALLKHASRRFRRAIHSHMKLLHNAGVHKGPHGAEDEDADLVERVAASPAYEDDDGLHHEMTGKGIKKWFRKAWHSVKGLARDAGDVIMAPLKIAGNIARGTTRATEKASDGDFTMLNSGLSSAKTAVGVAKDAVGVYNAMP